MITHGWLQTLKFIKGKLAGLSDCPTWLAIFGPGNPKMQCFCTFRTQNHYGLGRESQLLKINMSSSNSLSLIDKPYFFPTHTLVILIVLILYFFCMDVFQRDSNLQLTVLETCDLPVELSFRACGKNKGMWYHARYVQGCRCKHGIYEYIQTHIWLIFKPHNLSWFSEWSELCTQDMRTSWHTLTSCCEGGQCDK